VAYYKSGALTPSFSYPPRQRWDVDVVAYCKRGELTLSFSYPPRQRWDVDVVAYIEIGRQHVLHRESVFVYKKE